MRTIINFIIILGLFFRMLHALNVDQGSLIPEKYSGYSPTSTGDSLLIVDLQKGSVYNNDFFRKIFYTWTTKTQITDLRTTKTLLSRSKSETKGYSIYDLSLGDSSLKNNTYAKLLLEDRFSKKRFCWTRAWATVMGWEGEKYGDQLIRIELKEDAIIGKLDLENKEKPISFFDMKGNEIKPENISKNAGRIAAVYHVNFRKAKVTKRKYRGTYRSAKTVKEEMNAPFREFVIINESMIKSWEYGTSKVLDELKNESELIKKTGEYRKTHGNKADFMPEYLIQYWVTKDNVYDVQGSYYSCLAFDNDQYIFGSKKLSAIKSAIDAALKAQGAALEK